MSFFYKKLVEAEGEEITCPKTLGWSQSHTGWMNIHQGLVTHKTPGVGSVRGLERLL